MVENRYYGGSHNRQWHGNLGVKVERTKKQTKKEVKKMQWEIVAALVLAIPVILFPVAFVWYINIGGIVHAVREAKTAREKKLATAEVTAK